MDSMKGPGKFTKKPVEIEAFRMGIDPRPDWFTEKVSRNEIITHVVPGESYSGPFAFRKTYCEIKTLEGVMRGDYGDWIIKGIKGECYPCKPDIFELTYQPYPTPPLSGGSVEAAQQPENKENAREWILCASSDQRPGNMVSVYSGPDLDEDEMITVREVRPALRLPSSPRGDAHRQERG